MIYIRYTASSITSSTKNAKAEAAWNQDKAENLPHYFNQ